MGTPTSVTKTLIAGDDDNISLSQTPLAGGNLTINGIAASGGVATLDTQRQVLLTFASSEAARTFGLYGTNDDGNTISEVIAGAASTAVSALNYKTVTRITIDAASAGAIKVGTNGVGSTQWQAADPWVAPFNISIGVSVVATVNFTIQYTYDRDPFGIASPVVTPPVVWPLTALAAKAAATDSNITFPITAWRLTINSGTGSATAQAVQAGISG